MEQHLGRTGFYNSEKLEMAVRNSKRKINILAATKHTDSCQRGESASVCLGIKQKNNGSLV
jgi:hypothetical protein